jgi:thymidine phosphorylase
VKVGKGAFMKDEARARSLAEALVRVGTGANKQVVALLTRMDAPLGREIGNASETREALEVLHGKGPSDLVECTRVLAREMLQLGRVAATAEEADARLDEAIASGAALRTMERMVAAQGGDARVVAEPSRLELAPEKVQVLAARGGFVTGIDALAVGLAGVAMGAGRTRADQPVDFGVGVTLAKKPGESVAAGEPLATLHLRPGQDAEGLRARVAAAFELGDEAPTLPPLVAGRITA